MRCGAAVVRSTNDEVLGIINTQIIRTLDWLPRTLKSYQRKWKRTTIHKANV